MPWLLTGMLSVISSCMYINTDADFREKGSKKKTVGDKIKTVLMSSMIVFSNQPLKGQGWFYKIQ